MRLDCSLNTLKSGTLRRCDVSSTMPVCHNGKTVGDVPDFAMEGLHRCSITADNANQSNETDSHTRTCHASDEEDTHESHGSEETLVEDWMDQHGVLYMRGPNF